MNPCTTSNLEFPARHSFGVYNFTGSCSKVGVRRHLFVKSVNIFKSVKLLLWKETY